LGSGNVTNNAALAFNRSDSITVANTISGTGTLAQNGAGTTILTSSSNSYSGATTVSAGTLQVDANNALGTNAAGTSVSLGGSLKLNAVNYSTAEALTINGTGAGGSGALTNSGTSTYAGQITAATNASISAGGGTLNLTGGLVKDGTPLTLTGGGSININGTGISGASANSDLVVNGTSVTLNATSTYNGPTFIRNGGSLIAAVTDALPTSPRSAVSLDDSGTGSSSLSIQANVQMASLAGVSTSSVSSTTGTTLTLGAASGSTLFDGSFSGDASAIVGAVIPKTDDDPVKVFMVKTWEKDLAIDDPDWRVDIGEVEQTIMAFCQKHPKVREIACDPFRWQRSMEILEQAGLPIVEWPSTSARRMVPACAKFYDAVVEKRIQHDGDPVLTRHLANAVTKVDNLGPRIVKDKKSSPRKIDAAVAAILAVDRATVARMETVVPQFFG
jgi:autotransporter-associated beta strand protein